MNTYVAEYNEREVWDEWLGKHSTQPRQASDTASTLAPKPANSPKGKDTSLHINESLDECLNRLAKIYLNKSLNRPGGGVKKTTTPKGAPA